VFDFRYHALSLVAVFLALGIGIVLGSSLGDTVVSQANKDVRSSLRSDLVDARTSEQQQKTLLAQRDSFIDASFARIAGGKLRNQHVALIADGPLPGDLQDQIRGAVKSAGGTVDTLSRFDAQPDLATITQKLGPKIEGLGLAPDATRAIGRRVGRALISGNRLARQLQNSFPDQFTGVYGPADAVVYYRTGDNRNDQAKTFEAGLIEGVRSAGLPVVGVEQSTTNPTQIPFYIKSAVSSVDSVDEPAGRIALVLALAGNEGNWGFKKTADAPLPPPAGAAPSTSGG